MPKEIGAWVCEVCGTIFADEQVAIDCEALGVPPQTFDEGDTALLEMGTPAEIRVILLETWVQREKSRDGAVRHVRMWRVEFPGGGSDSVRQSNMD